MAYVLTNKTAQTPLGFGALGFAIEPGESATITDAQAALIQEHPVIAGWIDEGKITVEIEGLTESDIDAARKLEESVEAAKLAAEEAEAAKLALPEVKAPEVTPPKVPTPTAHKK